MSDLTLSDVEKLWMAQVGVWKNGVIDVFWLAQVGGCGTGVSDVLWLVQVCGLSIGVWNSLLKGRCGLLQ